MKRIFQAVLWTISLISLLVSAYIMLRPNTLGWIELLLLWFMIVLMLLPLGWAFISQYAICSVSQSLLIRLLPTALTFAFWVVEFHFHIYTLLLNVLGEYFSVGILEHLLCPAMIVIHAVTWAYYEYRQKHRVM